MAGGLERAGLRHRHHAADDDHHHHHDDDDVNGGGGGGVVVDVSYDKSPLRFTPAIELHGDQLGELGGDVCHRIFCSTEAGSRAEQGADFAESFVRRLVHNGDELVTRQKCGKLFVGYALCLETAQQRRRHQHDPDS